MSETRKTEEEIRERLAQIEQRYVEVSPEQANRLYQWIVALRWVLGE